LVILDAHAYGTVIMATQLPAGTQAARAERARWIQEALIDAVQVPHQVAEAALDVARLSLEIVKIGNHHAVSDAGMAAVLAHAAAQSAALNVKINLASIKDKKFKLRIWSDTMGILKEMADLEHQVLSVTYEKL
jgi:glutamate formiminotransferase/formiminotetrahydrofolate cyclodeaminase